MNLSALPAPIRAFFTASASRDLQALLTTFAPDAVAEDRHARLDAHDWLAEHYLADEIRVHPIHAAEQDGEVLVTVMARVRQHVTECDWRFRLAGSRIAELTQLGPRGVVVPEPVARFVRAVNLFDLEGLVDSFAPDALINDQLRDFWGREAIERWAEAEVVGEHMTIYVAEVLEHHGDIIVTAHVDGDFDKQGLPDPLILAFHFRVEHDRIVRLIILSNLDARSAPAVRQNLGGV